jgi:hypothetical protein
MNKLSKVGESIYKNKLYFYMLAMSNPQNEIKKTISPGTDVSCL